MSIAKEFQRLAGLLRKEEPAYVLAELNDLLTNAPGAQIEILSAPSIADPYLANYVAAMVEQAAHLKGGVRPPPWTAGVAPLAQPVFAVPWMALRAHLLLESPVPFRRRNIFVDSTIGDRV
ncbi:MAG: hypothetical protein EXQ57_06155 [Bryobacterales bacterium]|nr:hypothetical protein [Bryobacterales bacterium]